MILYAYLPVPIIIIIDKIIGVKMIIVNLNSLSKLLYFSIIVRIAYKNNINP
jgi:hypothetical protein